MAALVVQEDVALDRLNTFGLRARAARLVEVHSVAALQALVRSELWRNTPRRLILGGGSNLVLPAEYPGLVLRMRLQGRQLLGEDETAWQVMAAAGESWDGFVRWTLAQGWPGLENLILIPGTVGAAPVQNIGAYGVEMGEFLTGVDAVDLDSGQLCHIVVADCALAYRDSLFRRHPERWCIVAVHFRLPRRWSPRLGYAELAQALAAQAGAEPGPQQIAEAVASIRRRKLPDPAMLGNAGSFFKNPLVDAGRHATLKSRWPQLPAYRQPDGCYKLAAGWLIEQCGWKGRDLGPVGCYERQALVLVNRGGACGDDVMRLAAAIQADVRACFGLDLEIEPIRP